MLICISANCAIRSKGTALPWKGNIIVYCDGTQKVCCITIIHLWHELDFVVATYLSLLNQVITFRIRRMREINIFSLSTLAGGGGGGAIPRSGQGKGYPIPSLDRGGTPIQVRMGGVGTLSRSGQGGIPPGLDGVTPTPQDWIGYPSGEEKHSEHLLRGGRYASCVHAGGLYCCVFLCKTKIVICCLT